MREPTLSVFVCGIQRAGTWLLAHLLRSTGVAGRPEEFFDPDEIRHRRAAWRVSDDAYFARVKEEGTTPNGVFAAKLQWNARPQLLFLVRRVLRDYDSADLHALAAFFPNPRFVWLRREDEVAQAVSWAKAAQTGQYAAHQTPRQDPVFDFDAIDGLVHLIRLEDGVWRRWFDEQGVRPFELTYERLCADPVAMTLRILGSLEVEPPPTVEIAAPPELTQQADAASADWIARYRKLAQAH